MEDITEVLNVFLAEIKNSIGGSQVKFSVDYKKNQIVVVNASSGFVKQITNVENACTHLTDKGLTFQLFKRLN